MQTQYETASYDGAIYDDRTDFVHINYVEQVLYALEFYGCDFAG